jgi:hypothetical protein
MKQNNDEIWNIGSLSFMKYNKFKVQNQMATILLP